MRAGRQRWTFIFVVIVFVIAGTFVGDLLGNSISIFARDFSLRLLSQEGSGWLLDLYFIKIQLGFLFRLNLGSIIFLIIGLILFYKR